MRAPRWARALLRFCVPASRREDVIGDLEEVHARRRARYGSLRAWLASSGEAVTVAASFLPGRWRDALSRSVWLSWPEVKLAVRMARKQPLLNLAALLALATGLALSAAAFSFMDMTFFGRLPFPDGDRFVRLSIVTEEGEPATLERDRFEALSRSGAFRYLGAAADGSANLLSDDGRVEALRGVTVSADVFLVLPYRPLLGRTLVPADGADGAAPVALIGARTWKQRFGADPFIIGRTVTLGATEREIVGVMPEDAGFPNRPEVWTPLRLGDLEGSGHPAGPGINVFGVLQEGTTVTAAEQRTVTLSRAFEAEHPEAPRLRIGVAPFTEVPQRGLVQLLLGSVLTAVLAVLLVISANVGNLVSARTAARRSELAVRTALGAGRRRLVSQLFVEVLILGGSAALLAAWGLTLLTRYLSVTLAGDLPFWLDFRPGPTTWAFLVLATLLACMVAGGLPALRATRGAPGDGLRTAGREGGAAVFGRAASAMSVLQVALSVALVGGALLAVRGMQRYAGARPAVPSAHLLTAGMYLSDPTDADPSGSVAERIESTAAGLAGVDRVGFATAIPGVEAPLERVALEPLPGEEAAEPRLAPVARARPGFLETMGATPVLGRLLAPGDLVPGASPVAVVNQSFARTFLQGRNPLGRRVRVLSPRRSRAGAEDAPLWREIVGVVPDLGLSVGDPALEGGLYIPLTEPSWAYLVLSVPGDPTAMADPLRRVLARSEPDLLVPRVQTLEHAGSENAKALGLFGGLLSALGGMALLLSLVSTYALVSFTVSRRVREVGVRVALGASRTQVLTSVAGRAAVQIALGAALGTPLGALLVQTKRLFVFRVPSGEPWLLPLVALLMVSAGALASWVPARRALRVGPSEALKAE